MMSGRFFQNILLVFVLTMFCPVGGVSQESSQNIGAKQPNGDTCHDSIITVPQSLPDAQKNYGVRGQWDVSKYIKMADMIINSPVGHDPHNERYRHSTELLLEGYQRFGPVPEICMQLAGIYEYFNKPDTVFIYLDLAENACQDSLISEGYRKLCFGDEGFLQRIRSIRRNYQEVLERQKASDTVSNGSNE